MLFLTFSNHSGLTRCTIWKWLLFPFLSSHSRLCPQPARGWKRCAVFLASSAGLALTALNPVFFKVDAVNIFDLLLLALTAQIQA